MTLSAFSDELAQVRTKKKEFLEQIERIVPWKEWLAMIQPCYYKGERGNKPYPLETMLRLYLLQNLYDLSDEATVAEAIDSRAFSEFCGVDSSNQIPNGGYPRPLPEPADPERAAGKAVCSGGCSAHGAWPHSEKGYHCGFHHPFSPFFHEKQGEKARSGCPSGQEG